MAILKDVLTILRTATRIGADVDEPEGVRYILISDTLATELADKLEAHLLMQEHDAVRCPMCGGDMRDRMETFGLL